MRCEEFYATAKVAAQTTVRGTKKKILQVALSYQKKKKKTNPYFKLKDLITTNVAKDLIHQKEFSSFKQEVIDVSLKQAGLFSPVWQLCALYWILCKYANSSVQPEEGDGDDDDAEDAEDGGDHEQACKKSCVLWSTFDFLWLTQNFESLTAMPGQAIRTLPPCPTKDELTKQSQSTARVACSTLAKKRKEMESVFNQV